MEKLLRSSEQEGTNQDDFLQEQRERRVRQHDLSADRVRFRELHGQCLRRPLTFAREHEYKREAIQFERGRTNQNTAAWYSVRARPLDLPARDASRDTRLTCESGQTLHQHEDRPSAVEESPSNRWKQSNSGCSRKLWIEKSVARSTSLT